LKFEIFFKSNQIATELKEVKTAKERCEEKNKSLSEQIDALTKEK